MPPVNDNLADAILLTGSSVNADGTTVDSTNEADEITYGWNYGAGDVWYKWVAPDDGTVIVTLTAPLMDGEFDFYTGDTFATLNFVDWTPLNNGIATLAIPVTSGQEYKIQVPYYSVSGIFNLDLLFGVAHTITASAGSGGSISPSGSVSVDFGSFEIFTITPDANYEISTVLVDGLPVDLTDGTYTFTNVIEDHTIEASFALIPIITIPIDCGLLGVVTTQVTGLDHLEGETVSILADGEVLDPQVVSGGKIILDDSYAKVIVGLPYESDLETLNVELNDPEDILQGKKVKIGNVIFRVVATRGGFIGPNENVLYDAFNKAIIEKLGSEDFALSYTGDLRVPLGAGYEDGGRVFYKQKDPLPVNIGMIVPEIKIGGATG